MKKSKLSILTLCLMLSLTNAQLAFADGENSEAVKSFRPRIAAPLRSIGTVESIGALRIDGRMAKGQELLWGSELIQAPDNASARLSLNSVGQASLNPSSIVRITTVTSTDGRKIEHPTLIATLVKGSLNVQLQTGAVAYLTTGKTSFIASENAHFTVEMREGSLAANALRGTIANLGQWALTIPTDVLLAAERMVRMQEQATTRRYFLKSPDLGASIDVRARSTYQLQVQVTDDHDKPVPDMPVKFSLGGSSPESLGTLNAAGVSGATVVAPTNALGIATVTFTAKATVGSLPLSASIPGATLTFSSTIYISAGAVFWTMATALPVIATAAAAIIAGVSVAATQDKKQPVSTSGTLPPPVIKP